MSLNEQLSADQETNIVALRSVLNRFHVDIYYDDRDICISFRTEATFDQTWIGNRTFTDELEAVVPPGTLVFTHETVSCDCITDGN